MRIFVSQTTHQSSTKSTYFCWVERKSLNFRHFYRNMLKVFQKLSATAHFSARTKPAYDFNFITSTNLTKFNSCFKTTSKFFHKLSEINSVFAREVDVDFLFIKRSVTTNNFHLKPKVFNNLLCFFQKLFVECLNFFNLSKILMSGNSNNVFERFVSFCSINGLDWSCNRAKIKSAHRFNNHFISNVHQQIIW